MEIVKPLDTTTVYQTLEDRSNADEVERSGPYPAKRYKWLGDGYYFWDTHLQLAHRWGLSAYSQSGYMICVASCTIDASCWDLLGVGKHRIEFQEIYNELIESKITTPAKLVVREIIDYLKHHKRFKYQAIRASSNNATPNDKFSQKVLYRLGHREFFEVYPPIQICLLNKRP